MTEHNEFHLKNPCYFYDYFNGEKNWVYWVIACTDSRSYIADCYLKIKEETMPDYGNIYAGIGIQKCYTTSFDIYISKDEPMIIPHHDIELGVPIFSFPDDSLELPEDDTYWGWRCPQNFFATEHQAKFVLEQLKKKYNYITNQNEEDIQKSYFMNAFGRFSLTD